MKDINYYKELNTPYKCKAEFMGMVPRQIEKFVGTKSEIEAKEKELYEQAEEKYKLHCKRRREDQNAKTEEFKNDLAEENGVKNSPKLDLLWSKAWDMGHSSGFSEVKHYFEELVELID